MIVVLENRYGTHAEVKPLSAEEALPLNARILNSGESYYGIPYEVWRSRMGRTVDILALQHQQQRLSHSEHPSEKADRIPTGTRVIVFFTRLRWQLLVSVGVASLALLHIMSLEPASPLRDLLTPAQSITTLGVIGAIVALASSVSFGHLLHFVAEATQRKEDTYHRLHDRLYEFDDFLRRAPQDHPLVEEARRFSFELRKLRLSDFPVMDWDARVDPMIDQLEFGEDPDEWPNLTNEILSRLNHCEDYISTIGIMSIKQIIAGVLVRPVIKSFGLLAALLLSGAVVYFLAATGHFSAFAAVAPVFFASFAALLFVEVGWLLYRETEELIDFTVTEGEQTTRAAEPIA